MNVSKIIEIELTSEDISQIVTKYVSDRMEAQGYALATSKNSDGPIPDLKFTGTQVQSIKNEFE